MNLIVLLAISIALDLSAEWIIIILGVAEIIDMVREEQNRNRDVSTNNSRRN